MREIKFRAWDRIGLQMGEVLMINFNSGVVGVKVGCRSTLYIDNKKIPYTHKTLRLDEVDLMRFIGVLDEKGNEVYEGDIYKYFNELHAVDNKHDWSCDCYGSTYGWNFKHADPTISEVMGNIYETPDLLK